MPKVLRPTPSKFLALLLLLPIACSDSTAPDPGPDPDPGPGPGGGSGPAASVVIEPGAVLLTAAGETMQLEATVYDATGKPVQADVTWRSTDPGTVSMSGGGLATATTGLGSAQITAVAQGISSEPALALVAHPAADVILVPDSLILSDPVAVDPAAEYGPGWRYRIRVSGDAPEAGRLVLGTGGRALAGRLVGATAQGAETELTVEIVPLNQLFADLEIDETIPLVEMETGSEGSNLRAPDTGWGPASFEAADTEFTLGRFQCSASGEVPELDLLDPTLDIDPDLSLALSYANGLEKYAVIGSITADFGYKPVFKATFEGKVGCETVVTTATVPLFGPLALFFGIQVPLGVGVELDGKLEIAEVGFDVSAHARATAELGLLCPTTGGTCSGITSFDAERDFNFEFIAPDPTEQFQLELGGHGYLFAKPAVGSRFSRKAQFEFLAATAGLEQSVDLATPTRQVKETDYASGFRLAGLINVGPGKDLTSAIDNLGDLLGVDLDIDLTLVDIDETLAESPRGTFSITPASVEPGNDMTLGDMATFAVELDPVTYLGIESVDRIEIFWKKDDGSGGFTLEAGRPGCTDVSGNSGQTTFTCQTDFLDEHAGEQTFYAFVHARMFGVPLPIPFEIADDALATVSVGLTAAGVIPLLNESASTASTAEYVAYHADPGDLFGFAANVTSDSALYGTASVTATQTSVFHQAATPGHISMIGSEANASVSVVPDELDRTGGGKGDNVLSLTFDVSERPVNFVLQANFTTPSDSKHSGTFLLYLRNLDASTTDEAVVSENGTTDANIMREGTLPPGRYRFFVYQLAEAASRTDGAAVSTWDVQLEFR